LTSFTGSDGDTVSTCCEVPTVPTERRSRAVSNGMARNSAGLIASDMVLMPSV